MPETFPIAEIKGRSPDELARQLGDALGDLDGYIERRATELSAQKDLIDLTMAQIRVVALRSLAAGMLDKFTKTSDGYRARVGQVQISQWQATLEGSDPGTEQAEASDG